VRAHRGSKYDPDVVDAYLRLFKEKGYKDGGLTLLAQLITGNPRFDSISKVEAL
jgi:hypothetical protein